MAGVIMLTEMVSTLEEVWWWQAQGNFDPFISLVLGWEEEFSTTLIAHIDRKFQKYLYLLLYNIFVLTILSLKFMALN
jgi:hypothetical protein